MSTRDAASTQLHELAELGMDLVRRIAAAVEADPDTATLIALADAHCDVARSVRQSIALRLRIASGSFEVQRPPKAEADPDAEPEECEERGDPVERCDWNEYERPDWETPLRLTGDPAHDDAIIQTAVETAVRKIRKSYAKGLAVLDPERKPTARAALLAGSAPLRIADTS
ncbi:hypothetical protein [Phenylobacterium sp.]|uniref:hypothetical protein n=1 Tax=Phenylobacterium sp. TaxID=1871053 RepID=UPI0025F6A3F7|nr:hypothetical protein [Phenylobacterium sp.]MBX3484843.1 hypothetical protein [Phenylobacterium sp.]MCW5759188.1 hypothetical protein [Phenylobacterium sp.]